MADTTSIASRMEKLAKLKRMKQGLSAPATTAAKPAPEPEVAPATASPAAPVSQEPLGTHDISSMIQEEMAIGATAPVEQFSHEAVEQFDPEAVEQVAPEAVEQFDPNAVEQVTEESDDSFVSLEAIDEETAEPFAAEAAEEFAPEATVEAEADTEDASFNEPILVGADGSEANMLDDDSTEILSETVADDEDDLGDEIPADLQGDDSSEEIAAEAPEADAGDETITESTSTAAVLVAEDLNADEDAAAADALDEIVAIGDREDAPLPDFAAREIDPQLLAQEFGDADAGEADAPIASEDKEGRVAVTFDESRTTLLNHVSRQMNCSVEDVVVTALDWYLDALFGEDGEAKTG